MMDDTEVTTRAAIDNQEVVLIFDRLDGHAQPTPILALPLRILPPARLTRQQTAAGNLARRVAIVGLFDRR